MCARSLPSDVPLSNKPVVTEAFDNGELDIDQVANPPQPDDASAA